MDVLYPKYFHYKIGSKCKNIRKLNNKIFSLLKKKISTVIQIARGHIIQAKNFLTENLMQ